MEKRNNIADREVRCFLNPVTIREDGESREVVGTAIAFDQLSRTIGWFREKIDPRALENADMNDVVALFNHNIDYVLARTLSQTLTLEKTDKELRYRFLAPNTTAGNDLIESIRRGDIQHSSFSFSISEDKWEEDEEGNEIRTVLAIKRLYDVSPVVNPAYLQTNVDLAKRSYDNWQSERNQDGIEKEEPPAYDDLEVTELDLELRRIQK